MWREIWRRLFDLEDDEPVERQHERLEATLGAIDPALVARTPLLSSLRRARHPGHGAHGAPRCQGAQGLARGPARRSPSGRGQPSEPIILVLEDCHWIDPLSRDLLEVLCRATAALPVLIVLAYRPAPEVGGGLGDRTDPRTSAEMSLDVLVERRRRRRSSTSKLTQVAGGAAADGSRATRATSSSAS